MALTDRQIQLSKTNNADLFLNDGKGLYLRVRLSGSKTWLYRYKTSNNKTQWLDLGLYPERDVLILPLAGEALERQKEFTLSIGGRVFHNNQTNKPWVTDGQIRKIGWIPALKTAGVLYRNPYQTRHTYASMLLSAGENPMWVAQQMGHADWGMIRKRYGRWIPSVDTSAGSRIIQQWSLISHGSTVTS